MESIFCPFVNGDCRVECVFNNGCFKTGEKENCDLTDVVMVVRSLGEKDSLIDKRLSEIGENTSRDHTESYGILSTLEDIKRLLKKD